jgi:hypothetical protein
VVVLLYKTSSCALVLLSLVLSISIISLVLFIGNYEVLAKYFFP